MRVQWLSFVTGFLRPAEKRGAIDVWTDRLMPGGADWGPEIERKLRGCDIFMLLISRHSMSSDYVVDKEIGIIRERQKNCEDVHFYPLLLTPTPEIGLDIVRDKNLRPRDGRPFSSYSPHDREQLMSDVANEIVKTAVEIGARKCERPPPPPAAFPGSYDDSLTVHFRAYWQPIIKPGVWQTLLVYVYSGQGGRSGAIEDFRGRQSGHRDSYDNSSSVATKKIRRGTEISIYPELDGFRFNPPVVHVIWLEDWHCVEFRMQALGEKIDLAGRVSFFVGPLLIGETGLYAFTGEPPEADGNSWDGTETSPYRAIFVSYSHDDAIVVNLLERSSELWAIFIFVIREYYLVVRLGALNY